VPFPPPLAATSREETFPPPASFEDRSGRHGAGVTAARRRRTLASRQRHPPCERLRHTSCWPVGPKDERQWENELPLGGAPITRAVPFAGRARGPSARNWLGRQPGLRRSRISVVPRTACPEGASVRPAKGNALVAKDAHRPSIFPPPAFRSNGPTVLPRSRGVPPGERLGLRPACCSASDLDCVALASSPVPLAFRPCSSRRLLRQRVARRRFLRQRPARTVVGAAVLASLPPDAHEHWPAASATRRGRSGQRIGLLSPVLSAWGFI